MNKRIRIVLLTAVLAASAVGVTGAKEQSMPKGKGVATKGIPFEVTGVYSGPLSGEITIDGKSIHITDKTTFHKVGVGALESSTSVSNSAILVSGVMKGKKAIASIVLIGEPTASSDFSQTTVEDADRDPKAAAERR